MQQGQNFHVTVSSVQLPSSFVNEKRLWQRHMQLAEIGSTAAGGCCRLAFSQHDGKARAVVISWARKMGLVCQTDTIGNLFLRYTPRSCNAGLPPIMTGSHLDTEPEGGRFDGVFGVLAGLEAVDCIQAADVEIKRPIEVVIWSNEEGCNFQPGCMGSEAFTNPDRLQDFLNIRDDSGRSVGEALPRMAREYEVDEIQTTRATPAAFVEAHIEQGPILESLRRDIGIGTGIYGSCRLDVEILGEMAHAGATPRAARKDAFVCATRIVTALHDFMHDDDDVLRFTIGRFLVEPVSPSVVPGRVRFTMDMRHPDQDSLDSYRAEAVRICSENAAPCVSSVHEIIRVPCIAFDQKLQAQARAVADRLRLSNHSMPSGAGHDARNLATHCPTAMIFVPSHNGISHHPDEYTSPTQLADGARVLTDLVALLAQE